MESQARLQDFSKTESLSKADSTGLTSAADKSRLDLLSLALNTKPESEPKSESGPKANTQAATDSYRPTSAREISTLAASDKLNYSLISSKAAKGNSDLTHTAIDVSSSLTAGVGGTIFYSLAKSAPLPPLAKAATIPVAMLAGGLLKYGTKSGLEAAFVDESQRTASTRDILWGSVDALSGIGASKVETLVSSKYFTAIGRKELGSTVAAPVANHAGYLLAKSSLTEGFKANAVRGIAGGATGAAIWSAPHRTAENWQELKDDPTKTLAKITGQVTQDTVTGSLLGGGLGLAGTAVVRYKDVLGNTKASLFPRRDLLQLDNYHINDFHSNTEQLPRMATLVSRLQEQSKARGVDGRFFVPGDIESGRVNFAFTKGGEIENAALMKMGAKEIVPGNHAYDAPGGHGDVPRYPRVMEPLLKENPDVSLIAANLDVSSFDQYQRILKPYVVRTVRQNGVDHQVATIGLTTEEGAIDGLRYIDAKTVAERAIKALNDQGIRKINIHSHLGLGEDIKLAQHLIDKDLKVAGIFGGHSHDALPRPLWVGRAASDPEKGWRSFIPFLRSRQSGNFEIPIAQAGDSGKWVGELRQAIDGDGIAHRYQTTGKLHQVKADLPEDPGIRKFLDDNLTDINSLKAEAYNATATAPYEVANSRNRETAIGNLMADAIRSGLKNRLGDQAPQAVLVHSGGIRADIPGGTPLTRLDIANIVMNAGKREGEIKELAMVHLTGSQLKDAIEYGVRERAVAPPLSWSQKLKSLFTEPVSELVDEPGNFVQASGLRYSFDASKAPLTPQGGGQRVTSLEIQNAQGVYEAVKPDEIYNVATRFHPLEKWQKYNIFGTGKTIDQVHAQTGASPLPYSQVDLIGEYLANRTLNPLKDSAVEGRIKDFTPGATADLLRPGKSLFTQPAVIASDRDKNNRDKNK